MANLFFFCQMPNYDNSYVVHLQKMLRTMGGQDQESSLRVTLEDLLMSETRGRWWVVGSAWTGASVGQTKNLKPNPNRAGPMQPSQFTASFMKLAENMRMTRPPKINILFVLTVGSSTSTECFQSILTLNLPSTQEKIIFDVMLYCVQKMKKYRNFYSLVSADLGNHDAKFKRHLQHALWDKFSDFDALKARELKNLANFVVEIVKSDVLNLSLLKTLPFADADKKIVAFLENVLQQIFDAEEGCHISQYAFEQLFKSPKMKTFRIQLRMFIRLFVVPKLDKGEISPTSPLFRKRVDHALDTLSVDQGALL